MRTSLAYQYENPESDRWLQAARVRVYFQDSKVEEENEERRSIVDRRTGQATPVRRETENEFTDRVWGGDVQLQSNFSLGSIANRLTYGFDISTTRNERPRDRTQVNLNTGESTTKLTSATAVGV